MGRFRRGQEAFAAGEQLRGFEDVGLLNGDGFHVTVVVELGEDRAHAVVAETAGVVGAGDEAGAEGIHLCERSDLTGVAEVVGELASRQGRAGGGLDGDDAVVGFASQFLAHEGGDETAEVGTAAGTADDDVGGHVDLFKSRLGFETDDGLMQEDLVQDRTEDVAVTFLRDFRFDRFGNGAAERAGGVGVFREDLAADLRRVGRGGDDGRSVGAHDFPAEGLLLIGDLDHVDLAVEAEVGTGHGEGRAPLAGTGLGRDAFQALVLRVVGLCNGGVQLVGAGGVVAFELVVDLRRGLELFFQAVGADEGRRAIHLVEVADLVRDRDVPVLIVQFLGDEFVAEHGGQLFCRHGLHGAGVQERRRFVFHIGADVVPCLREFVFVEVHFVRDVVVSCGFHVETILSLRYFVEQA